MSKVQYAVCHLQRGSGSDSGMTCHIERKDAEGKMYVPKNADPSHTHLNRELIVFPEGVKSRTEAIQYRIDNAKLHRKVGKNQTKAIRIILTGTHEQMMKIADEGRLEKWIEANLRWLRETYGAENVVSCVLHMDELTPHLHATIVPIVSTPRQRREREGEKKYETRKGDRLSADDVMKRGKLFEYQNSYAESMKPFGLQRGIVGSTAKHVVNSDYYKQQMRQYEEDIAQLQAEVEKAKEGRSRFFAFIGKGDLAKAKKTLSEKDKEIAELQAKIDKLNAERAQLMEQHQKEIAGLKNGYQREIAAAISRAEAAERKAAQLTATIERQKQRIGELDRKANSERYRLSSGAELVRYFIPNRMYPSLHIWTKVGKEEYDDSRSVDYFSPVWQAYDRGEATIYELANEVFAPEEQVNEAQARLLGAMGAALTLASGGVAMPHVGTGSGGSSSDLPWGSADNDKNRRYSYGRKR